VLLSDGTKVYLNSGSSLTYPVNFINGNSRKVYLTGEAYFEVTHTDDMFIVNTRELDVQVYGTKFNLSNYPEDPDTELVLIDGSVSMSDAGKSKDSRDELYLVPGYKGAFNKANKNFINEKVNTSLYTAWMNGSLVFRNASFEKILHKLERQYNVVILNNNEKLAHETFNATIETDHENIEQVLRYFNKVYQIDYRIIDNKIIIN
jgi:ferric-dicitrate binding protein FerR (iron transport regulator)